MFERDHRGLIDDCIAAERAYNRAPRDEAEERYGDYVDLVETGTEVLAELRDNFARRSTRTPPRSTSDAFNARRNEALPALRTRDRGSLSGARSRTTRLIGDLQTAALVGRDGSIDWVVLPALRLRRVLRRAARRRRSTGAGSLAPARRMLASAAAAIGRTRSILETEWETDTGAVRVIDFMPPRGEAPDIVRIVEGVARRRRDEHGARHPLRLRLHGPVGRGGSTTAASRSPGRTRSASARPSSIAARTCARSASSRCARANACRSS